MLPLRQRPCWSCPSTSRPAESRDDKIWVVKTKFLMPARPCKVRRCRVDRREKQCMSGVAANGAGRADGTALTAVFWHRGGPLDSKHPTSYRGKTVTDGSRLRGGRRLRYLLRGSSPTILGNNNGASQGGGAENGRAPERARLTTSLSVGRRKEPSYRAVTRTWPRYQMSAARRGSSICRRAQWSAHGLFKRHALPVAPVGITDAQRTTKSARRAVGGAGPLRFPISYPTILKRHPGQPASR